MDTLRRSFVKKIRPLYGQIVDLLFPPRCVSCGKVGSWFCPTCAQAVIPIKPPICIRCGRPVDPGVSMCSRCTADTQQALRFVRAAAVYADPLRSAIHCLKYEHRPELGSLLGRYLVTVLRQDDVRNRMGAIDAIVPVPLHPKRLIERGYNQSELLATELARRTGLSVQPGWLSRCRETHTQTKLSRAERQLNVAGAFQAAPDVRGQRILIVDDVYTTGATMNACALAIKDAGGSDVCAVALATPLRPDDLL